MKHLEENHEQNNFLQEGAPANQELMYPHIPAVEQLDQLQQAITSAKVDLSEIGLATLPANNFPNLVATNPALDAVRDIQASTATLAIADQSVKNATAHPIFAELGELALSTQVPNYSFTSPILNQINTGVTKIVRAFSSELAQMLANSVRNISVNLGTAMIDALQSPAMKWFQSLDFSPMYRKLETLNEIFKSREEFKAAYLLAMYECKWFPYAGWLRDTTLTSSVAEVMETSRGASKRREKRIDKLILAYYTPKRINAIRRSWRGLGIEAHVKKILCQAMDAHLRGEYALTISSLASMWEGMIYTKANNVPMHERHRQKMSVTKKDLAELTEANDYERIFSDYFDNFIVSQCNKVDDVIDGVPNRHGVSHSWYRSYPSKKASLNAIMLTDYILRLEPLDTAKTAPQVT